MTAPHERYRQFLETLAPGSLGRLRDHVIDDVHFRDPFNDVRGAEAMLRVFHHMFDNVENIRFVVQNILAKEDICLMEWKFEGILAKKPWVFDGTSIIRFDPDGRVVEHIDHWDAARNFYEHLPVIGWILAWIRRRLAVR